jgi:hypothetical protein
MFQFLSKIIFLSLFTLPLFSHAVGANGTITIEGCHAQDSQCFVALDSTALASCKYGLIYYDLNLAGSKGIKASIISVKVTKKTVSLDYYQDGSGVCHLNYLYQNP